VKTIDLALKYTIKKLFFNKNLSRNF